MSTSLAEQLRRLQTPQTSQFVDARKRHSILFTSEEAATKSRETIYEIGISGLHELIELNPAFADFEDTLFELTAKDIQRAIESKEVNALLDKNIKRFMFHFSPCFMICLEWLIRRFSINLYNKDEFLMLIFSISSNKYVRSMHSNNEVKHCWR
ncbi:CLUMA_CG016123, isoform A [Clunio marinus]|uniref:HEAT repeat-containing protein 1 n=1 Tax=Clunio marinus TaxID=568069 RepID=A0A1J1ISF0_9DIPT|nr:CLUMA_CG016123, isoform A [Clunio marinus]